ncbi:MAG TPA: hypothetical protein VFG14_19380 [Chthoniobacteraceae bacterium]|nr:hypothetical protein [Chthoniobacteraceae bacterium]
MRIIGCTLVAIGFLWLVTVQFLIRPTAAAVMVKQYQTIEENRQFSGEEVRRQVFLSTTEVADRIPVILVPALVMLLGSVLIDQATRRV